MKRIYISGSNGFIGSFLRDKFLNNGYEVIKENYRLEEIKNLRDYSIDTIIHCAAKVSTNYCNANPNEASMTNVYGTWNIASRAKFLGAKFVYISTIAIYDYNQVINYITEDSKIKPHTWYGMTKYLGEKISESIFEDQFLNLRLGFIFGPPEKDKYSFISGLLNKREVPLVGNYFKDYLYIDDCIEAVHRLIDKDKKGIFNLGSGCNYSTKKILQELGFSDFKFDNEKDYFKSFIVDSKKLQTEIEWIPQVNFWDKLKELKEEVEKCHQ